MGASLWDLDVLLADIDPAQIAVGFDVRHATVEGGTTWKASWHLIQERLGAVYVKDFSWKDRKPHNVPLSEGQVVRISSSWLRNDQTCRLPFTWSTSVK